mmetsp:Transcript_39742/g.86659  ORF Transcript_39742/g.86659 Transcript_39742/m.86659 type:complete len:84 (+) Transcript_39742:625-876(+)
MLSNTHRVRLIDFGSSRDLLENKMSAGNGRKTHMYKHYVGTCNYMPMECIRNESSDKPVDIFSLGCTLFWLYTGAPMFYDISE